MHVRQLFERAEKATASLDVARMEEAAAILHDVRMTRGVVLTAGNGGSSSTAAHFAGDLAKFPRVEGMPHIKSVNLTDNVPCHSAWANDDLPQRAMMHLAEPWLQEPDENNVNAVVLFSVHGGSRDGSVSTNLVELAQYAKQQGAKIIAVTGFDGGALGDMTDSHLNVGMFDEPFATPGVESVHLLIAHALCLRLVELGKAGK